MDFCCAGIASHQIQKYIWVTSNVLIWGLFYVKWNQVVTEFASGEEKAKFKLKKIK